MKSVKVVGAAVACVVLAACQTKAPTGTGVDRHDPKIEAVLAVMKRFQSVHRDALRTWFTAALEPTGMDVEMTGDGLSDDGTPPYSYQILYSLSTLSRCKVMVVTEAYMMRDSDKSDVEQIKLWWDGAAWVDHPAATTGPGVS